MRLGIGRIVVESDRFSERGFDRLGNAMAFFDEIISRQILQSFAKLYTSTHRSTTVGKLQTEASRRDFSGGLVAAFSTLGLATRKKVFAEIETTRESIYGFHLPWPGLGVVISNGRKGYQGLPHRTGGI